MGHDRTKVRTADADVDYIANTLAGVPLPIAAADTVAEMAHPLEYSVDLRNHVHTINEDGCTPWRAQRHMQYRTLFRGVDLLAAEHGIDPRLQAGLLCQLNQ
jgi:hypothetical protein